MNQFATGHKYTCDHSYQTSVPEMATNYAYINQY